MGYTVFSCFVPIFTLWPLKLQADISKGLRNAVKFLWIKFIVLTQILCKFFLPPRTNIDLKKKKKKKKSKENNELIHLIYVSSITTSMPRFALFILGW